MILNRSVPRKMSRAVSVFILVAGVFVLPVAFTQVLSADPPAAKMSHDSLDEEANAGKPHDLAAWARQHGGSFSGGQLTLDIYDSDSPMHGKSNLTDSDLEFLKQAEGSNTPVKQVSGTVGSAPATGEFPYAVQFKQGATRFEDGDAITIQEIRGTAETFAQGNIYRIAGTYKLASHDKAMLAAYTTANNVADGTSRSLKVQRMYLDRGKGTFTLFLPMSYEGWPHVSFYPSDGGQSFGGNYFGTGDFVLKKWWGSKQKD